ncbi:putative ribosome biogenesis and assembly-related protein [Kockovaella imperatae]|uniref:Putative ribosome biogenesis and assembly-related protein n=1 Tax=Kockovaella imperatae TaxID=4999 RepID=A0A1Y1U9Y8_9TREE|nr:putative ribosome biogenesis and assembly-related protein [Kockovaella imperatae]ORX34364.1 putative ribosome biogenesis and assembly-related protein [Kockovaella imperatae]
MAGTTQHHHRATLKQSNKPFKSKHASKGSLKAQAKGKTAPSTSNHAKVSVSSKKARLNANAQKRELKRQHVVEDVKFFSTSSGGGQAPRIVSIVPLLPSLSPRRFLADLIPSLGLPEDEQQSTIESLNETGSYLVRAPKYKTSLQINLLPSLSVFPALDAALVSDYVVLLLSSVDEVQLEGEAVLRCLQGQAGGVEMVVAVQAPEDKPIVPNTKQLIHKSLLSFSRYFFPSISKIYSSESPNDAALLARAICEAAPKTDRKGDARGFVVAEGSNAVHWTEQEGGLGTLRVEGTVRGGHLSADRLVHIPGVGDFEIDSILAAGPSSIGRASRPLQNGMSVDIASDPLSTPTEQADDLTATNEIDPMANDQTWPTEDDIADAPHEQALRSTKRVPKGTSAYQAAWIVDEDDDEDEDDDDEDEEDDEMDMEDDEDDNDSVPDLVLADDTEEITTHDDRAHDDLDPEEEDREYEEYLKQRENAQAEDMMFPDEIDTPRHIPARTRFQRYRGLKSFRTSPWDPYENLPEDYARIFQFENFGATSKRIEKEARQGVKPGTRVVLVIRNVPADVTRDSPLPFIVHGLLQHEHKQTVSHLVVQRNTEYSEPVKAKDPLILSVGPRRYTIHPLFSQHVKGGGKGVNNVHKSEKFLRSGAAAVATFYGPVSFGKVPCLLLKNEGEGKVPSLVAMGSTLPPDPRRIIAKRIILTGHPLKIHKKTATIRYMFFNRPDVEYFQSVELHTKFGRVGHITEPLGTHGYFKAHFDGPINQMDTICMNLYKRQYPKWSEDYKTQAGEGDKADEMMIEV